MHGHGDRTLHGFFVPYPIYIHESYDSSIGESDVRINISMVVVPHDGDIVGHHPLSWMERLVEDILTEMICQTLTS